MKSFKLLKNTKGITLIALVVTIVVLLILAAVSISMLTGENGIITQAQDSKDKTEQAKCEEFVTVAINGLIAENEGDRSKITPEKIAEQVNKENNRDDVTAEGSTFPTNIIFNEEGRKVGVDIELGVTEEIKEEIYSADVSEEDIAPTDIFKYEIISDAETGATSMDSLPTKEVKITGIKEKFCNSFEDGYYTSTGDVYENTNYEIILEDGNKITDTLVIPYQVEIDGEMYKITEANIYARGALSGSKGGSLSMPKVKTIIYPNTIKKIDGHSTDFIFFNTTLKSTILSDNLQELGDKAFYGCTTLINIRIPKNVTNIGDSVFLGCSSLTNIEIPDSVTNIGDSAFSGCSSLTNIEIPDSVTNIGYGAFSGCSSLTNIEIPDSVTNIGDSAFYGCSSLTNIEIPDSVTNIGGSAFSGCSSLTNIEIPDSVTNIGYGAFSGCSSFTSIEIPSSVTSIGNSAFYNCNSLTNIEIPSSVTSIGYSAFKGCTDLTTVNYTGTKEEWNILLESTSSWNDNLINAKIICTDGIINE